LIYPEKEKQILVLNTAFSTGETTVQKEKLLYLTGQTALTSEKIRQLEKSIIISTSTTVTTLKIVTKEKGAVFIEKQEVVTLEDDLDQNKELLLGFSDNQSLLEQAKQGKEKQLQLSALYKPQETTVYQKELMFSQQNGMSLELLKSVSKEVSMLFVEIYESVKIEPQVLTFPQIATIFSTSTHGFALIAFVIAISALAITLSIKQRQART